MTNIAIGVMKHGYTQHQCVSPTIRYSEHGHIGHSSSHLTCHRKAAATSSSSSRGTSSLCSDPRWSRQHLREMIRAARRGGGPPLLGQETPCHHLEAPEQNREQKWEGVKCNENIDNRPPHAYLIFSRRTKSSTPDTVTDASSVSTGSSDLSEEKVENKREKLFIIDILKNADEKKEKVSFWF